jgi:hypothetical protein
MIDRDLVGISYQIRSKGTLVVIINKITTFTIVPVKTESGGLYITHKT